MLCLMALGAQRLIVCRAECGIFFVVSLCRKRLLADFANGTFGENLKPKFLVKCAVVGTIFLRALAAKV